MGAVSAGAGRCPLDSRFMVTLQCSPSLQPYGEYVVYLSAGHEKLAATVVPCRLPGLNGLSLFLSIALCFSVAHSFAISPYLCVSLIHSVSVSLTVSLSRSVFLALRACLSPFFPFAVRLCHFHSLFFCLISLSVLFALFLLH